MADTIIYLLEKYDARENEDFEEVNFYHDSDLEKAKKDFEFLKEHGGLEYRLREIKICPGGHWEWKVIDANFELSKSED